MGGLHESEYEVVEVTETPCYCTWLIKVCPYVGTCYKLLSGSHMSPRLKAVARTGMGGGSNSCKCKCRGHALWNCPCYHVIARVGMGGGGSRHPPPEYATAPPPQPQVKE